MPYIEDKVIESNYETRRELFDKLPFSLANDVWFYVHLGNYGGTRCVFRYRGDRERIAFDLEFFRGGEFLFEDAFDGRYDLWDTFVARLKSHARDILGVA